MKVKGHKLPLFLGICYNWLKKSKEAQIAKDTRKIPGKLIIVEDEENGTHILFELADQTEPSTETKEFKVKKVID